MLAYCIANLEVKRERITQHLRWVEYQHTHLVNIVELLEHVLRATTALLRWLEKQLHRAFECVAPSSQDFSCHQHHRNVAIVAAGVHHPVVLRCVFAVWCGFHDRKGLRVVRSDGRWWQSSHTP